MNSVKPRDGPEIGGHGRLDAVAIEQFDDSENPNTIAVLIPAVLADEVAKLQAASAVGAAPSDSFGIGKGGFDLQAIIFWLFVGIPLVWGVWKTLQSAAALF
jgi:hypothetical protein